MTRTPTTTLDPDPLSVDCDPEPLGCGQPAGSPCVSIARGRFRGGWKRQPCQRRAKRAGVVLPPTIPDELRGDPPTHRPGLPWRRRTQGRIDWEGFAER